jgi:hypothetical protein
LSSHVSERYGEAAWSQVTARLSNADRAAMPSIFVTAAWYPVGVWNRALKSHLDHNVADPRAELVALARRVADSDLHTLFKIMLKGASPETILRRVGWLWARYFDAGEMGLLEEATRSARVRLDAPTGEEEGAGEPTCSWGVVGWLTEALYLVGARSASVKHVKCRFGHAKHCEYHVTW